MKEVVIDRARWYRGKTSRGSRLLTGTGKMCCLGFLCKAFGATDTQIQGVAFPSLVSTWGMEPWLPAELNWLSLVEEEVIGAVNDDKDIEDEVRESFITQEFAKQDIVVSFTN